MTRRLVHGMAVLFVSAVAAFATSQNPFVDIRETETHTAKVDFFRGTTLGTLAMMPNVRSTREVPVEHTYIRFPSSGRYSVSRSTMSGDDWWFVINHRTTVLGPNATYMGVLIAKLFETELDRPLQLFRNPGWRRSTDDVLPLLSRGFRSIHDFLQLQEEGQRQATFEEEFGVWHANPYGNADESSWDDRDRWLTRQSVEQCFRSTGSELSQGNMVMYDARLIGFQTTSKTNSPSPVHWNMNTAGVNVLYIKTFSPIRGDFGGEYCVAID